MPPNRNEQICPNIGAQQRDRRGRSALVVLHDDVEASRPALTRQSALGHDKALSPSPVSASSTEIIWIAALTVMRPSHRLHIQVGSFALSSCVVDDL